MSPVTLLNQTKPTTIGNKPVVVLPLDVWEYFADQLEDLAMASARFNKKITSSRKAYVAGKFKVYQPKAA